MQQLIHLAGQPEAVADQVFVRQALAGDKDAFEALVRRYHGPVFRFIRGYVRDNDQAWDVFQQVLLKLFVSLPNLRMAQEQLGPWLYHTARNCCIDALCVRRIVRFSELEWEAEEDGEDRFPPGIPRRPRPFSRGNGRAP
jgi:RNA polymerase sigma factor (sigma-70 family)